VTFIAVTVEPGCGIDDAEAHSACKAVDAQAREMADAWGCEYTPVVYFSADVLVKLEGKELAKFTANARLLAVQVDIDAPGAAGYHTDIAGVIFARVMAGEDWTVTLSHEVLEEMGDPTCEEYADMGLPDGRSQAREACDRVERDVYSVETDGYFVRLSNYLLPSAFKPNSQRPWDRLGTLHAWDGMTPGGYTIIRSADGDETDVFAATEAGGALARAKSQRPWTRAARRLGEIMPDAPVADLPDKLSGKSPRRRKRA
jgi:hypothetical protein